ncbi:MAG: acyl-CoA dehydrogenase family protein [Gammaproteobacteria bacterium]|nr:acyl-CoA dehydrogenase family protein [Gammaproteobacteria bacterium]
MTPFAAPIDEILLSLQFVANAEVCEDWDGDLARELAEHFASFAEGEIAATNGDGDQIGAQFIDGHVQMPPSFKPVFAAYCEQGWPGLTVPDTYGGQGLGAIYLAIVSEIFSGANQSLQMVTGLVPGAVRTLLQYGSDAQRDHWLPKLASGEALSTMCLTEPGAGSDLSRIRSKAVPNGDSWLISGEKIFISGGDQDLSNEIFHLVLARTSDDGIKGLSLFACGSHRANGSRNAVNVARIEEKMGLHGSPTCQMVFEDAEATLVGEPGQGLMAMFTMMNHARIDVSLQGVAHATRAHDIARKYTAERVQGRGADGAATTLDQHPDVQRMLLESKALAMGSRFMTHCTLVALETGCDAALTDYLTALIKVFSTEAGMKAAELGTQMLGGYGYLREYMVEQHYRDVRIAAIYEGANGIHAFSNATRGLKMGGDQAFADYVLTLGGKPMANRVEDYRQAAERVRVAPASSAHDFMQLSAWLFALACFEKYSRSAPSPDSALLEHVRKRVPARIRYHLELI